MRAAVRGSRALSVRRSSKLRNEVAELRRANEILKVGVPVFRARARPRPSEVSAFIDERRVDFGVEPICRTLGVSASAYYQRATGERSARAVEDERLLEVIRTTHKRNYAAYGYRRTWKALLRAGERVPRCQVQRLMAAHGISGRQAAREAVADHQGKSPSSAAPGISSSATSPLVSRIACGSAISRISAPGKASAISRSSSTSSPA